MPPCIVLILHSRVRGALVRSGAWQRSPQRRLSSAAPGGAADGKPGPKPLDRGNTPMRKGFDVLSSESGSKCVITGYDPHGFDVGRVNARSSILAFPGSFLLWAPRSFDEITLESLELIALTEPKPDVLLVGSGRVFNMRLDPQIMAYFKKHGIRVDVMDTRNAAATFNVLNSEDRLVVAALLKLDPHDPPPGYFAAAAAADPMLEKAHGRRGPQ
ncbi:NADH dehydrogenase 1 alpha subcomplex assembly factor 3 [Tribonema minus]|uniref:NADH dehydrogenase [ubiquinone] 1 alpha subcomplex assembly factor 3 n=1 Tax=Tribonema minus TaxID=303371 RepID=A0A835YSB6_9STRA|nr:NADH dehydrogenase 1 alpha subcomplex assembly factor 3 [Tribonema minus]